MSIFLQNIRFSAVSETQGSCPDEQQRRPALFAAPPSESRRDQPHHAPSCDWPIPKLMLYDPETGTCGEGGGGGLRKKINSDAFSMFSRVSFSI